MGVYGCVGWRDWGLFVRGEASVFVRVLEGERRVVDGVVWCFVWGSCGDRFCDELFGGG